MNITKSQAWTPGLAWCCFFAFHAAVNQPDICVRLHGRNAQHLQADHFKHGLQVPQLSRHDGANKSTQGRGRGRATNPILHRNLGQHAAIVFVRQIGLPERGFFSKKGSMCQRRQTTWKLSVSNVQGAWLLPSLQNRPPRKCLASFQCPMILPLCVC